MEELKEYLQFQSTRPCGARLITGSVITLEYLFQSTRPCGARHDNMRDNLREFGISIHAPLRGATVGYGGNIPQYLISIHAPLRGATSYDVPPTSSNANFNPRAPAGRDVVCSFFLLFTQISIHAPLRGATTTSPYTL